MHSKGGESFVFIVNDKNIVDITKEAFDIQKVVNLGIFQVL